MTPGQITASDINNWDSLDDIAASFEKRGLKPLPEISEDGRLVLELADGEFIELIEASTGKAATDYKPGSVTRHTNLVSTDDFETFTFITRVRDWDAHGRIKYQQFSFEKEQFRRESGEKNTVLQKLNEIEYGKSAAVMDDLYDTRQIVKEFYEQFESLRTDLVQEVSGIPDDRGDAKGRYVQVLLDRMIFLYFIQEKNLLDYDAEYLHDHHERVVDEEGDVYADFYDPLFFDLLAEGKNDPEFGKLPYLNGGLFSKNPIEEEFEDAKLGEDAEETNALFGRILDFLSDWNWNVDERLDIVDPKNLSPAVLGHIFEQTVNQKEMGAYYTPEEVTGFMARQTIHPYLLDQLNDAEGANYESIDEVFSLDTASLEDGKKEAIADGGVLAHEVDTGVIKQDHVETLYFEVLKRTRVLDPAVGSGAFLLAAQEVLLDVYLQCIEYFIAQEQKEPWELTSQIRDELDTIRNSKESETLYAKREIILNNLYGVDIDDGAVEICKLRLWLSMVADIEDEPREVQPLPNIGFNIRSGDSLIGFDSTEVVVDEQKLLITELLKDDLEEYRETIRKYKSNEKNVSKLRGELNTLHDEMQAQLDDWFAGLPDVTVEDEVSEPDELESIISSAHKDVKLKLKFASPIDDDLDKRLNDMGFRTWKKAANLEMGNDDVLAGRHQQIFEVIPEDKLTRSFVERGLVREDIEQLNPFHWVMEFPDAYVDVEDDGSIVHRSDPGFDVVLENPPYVRVQTMETLKRDIYKDRHETITGKCDLYIPFMERSFELLSEKGQTGIITSNLFMKTEYGEEIRRHLPENYGLEKIFDFTAYSVFDDVTIYSTILFGSRDVGIPTDCVSVRSEEAVEKVKSTAFNWDDSEDIVEFTLTADSLGSERWLILSEEERTAWEKIQRQGDVTLGNEDLFTVGTPLKTAQKSLLQGDIVAESDDRYEIENNRISGSVETGIWRRIITPNEINRWNVSVPSEAVFFPYVTSNGEYQIIGEERFMSEYVDTYELLLGHKDDLLSRKDSRRTWRQLGRPWYSLFRTGSPDYFERDKIVTDVVVSEPHFCIDTSGYLFENGFILGITPLETDPYYLIGLLNTDALFAYLKPISPPKNSGYIELFVDQLEQVPIHLPKIRDDICTEIKDILYEQDGKFDKLRQSIRANGVNEVVGSSEESEIITANFIREVSRTIVEQFAALSSEEVEQLEQLNNYLVGEIYGLTEGELRALSRI